MCLWVLYISRQYLHTHTHIHKVPHSHITDPVDTFFWQHPEFHDYFAVVSYFDTFIKKTQNSRFIFKPSSQFCNRNPEFFPRCIRAFPCTTKKGKNNWAFSVLLYGFWGKALGSLGVSCVFTFAVDRVTTSSITSARGCLVSSLQRLLPVCPSSQCESLSLRPLFFCLISSVSAERMEVVCVLGGGGCGGIGSWNQGGWQSKTLVV